MANVTSTETVVGNSISVNAGDFRVREKIITFSDIANAGTYATDDTYTFQVPIKAGEVVTAVSAKLITAFAGSGDQLNLTAGDGSDADGFLESAALHTSQTEISYVWNTGDYFLGEAGTTDPENVTNGKLYTSDDTVDFLFDGTAGASIDLDDLTAGELKIKVFYKDLN